MGKGSEGVFSFVFYPFLFFSFRFFWERMRLRGGGRLCNLKGQVLITCHFVGYTWRSTIGWEEGSYLVRFSMWRMDKLMTWIYGQMIGYNAGILSPTFEWLMAAKNNITFSLKKFGEAFNNIEIIEYIHYFTFWKK